MATPSGDWPLSAAATQLLRVPKEDGRELLKLTLKELVLRKVWAVEERPQKKLLHGHRIVKAFVPGERDCPQLGPLPRVDAALRSVCRPDGHEVRDAVKQIVGSGTRLTHGVREDARAEATGQGLLVVERTRKLGLVPWTTIELTPTGQSWLAETYRREDELGEALADRPEAALAHAGGMAALVLLATPLTLSALDDAVERLNAAGSAAFGGGDFGDLDLDFGGAFDGAFDSAVDAGSSDGGGGGDGGGGDGGS